MLSRDKLQKKTKDELIDFIFELSDAFQKKVAALEKTIEALSEQIKLLKHNRFGASSEKQADVPQDYFFDEAEMPANQSDIEADEEEITIPAHTRKKRGKKRLSADLPRKEIIYDLPEEEKQCACGRKLTCIGSEITEQLDIIPAKAYVIQHVCKKYACQHCKDTIKTAKKQKQPIPKGIAAPGLLANVLTSKFQFHLPLYRQEQQLKAIGADIPRNTLSLWVIKCSVLLQPLVNLLQDEILSYDLAYADESTLQVLKEKGKAIQSKSYIWVFAGGAPGKFSYLYQYHPNRKHHIAVDFFQGFNGYLHCDGYQAYDNLSAINKGVKQVACWYHARRKFFEAAKVSKKAGMADWFLKQIQRLAKLEKAIAAHALQPEEIYTYRKERAPLILDKIKVKLDEFQNKVPPQGLLGKAIHYTLNQWPKLQTYLEDGRLEISNNRMERAIKPFAVGRKNWLFSNSVAGAHAAANIFSLIETCKAHQVDPYTWLRETLTRIPTCETVEQFEALMPFNFKKQIL